MPDDEVVFERLPEFTSEGVFRWGQNLTPDEIAALPGPDDEVEAEEITDGE